MNIMETAEELYNEFLAGIAEINISDLQKVIAEHDAKKNKECADKIVDHLKDYEGAVFKLIDDEINLWQNNPTVKQALTELKQKLEAK